MQKKVDQAYACFIAFLISSDLSSSSYIESPGWYSNFRFRALRALRPLPTPWQTLCTFSQYLRGSRREDTDCVRLRTLHQRSVFPATFAPFSFVFRGRYRRLIARSRKSVDFQDWSVVLRSDVERNFNMVIDEIPGSDRS